MPESASSDARAAQPARATPLELRLLELLLQEPRGWREFDLLAALEERGQPGFRSRSERSRLDLYRRHYQLFHALYSLRDRLRAAALADLQVHCLEIRLLAYRNPEEHSPAARDELRDYYRDPGSIDSLCEEDVEALIEGGLKRIGARRRRAQALAVLGLADPVTSSQIRRRFHTLALQRHPDQGGDAQRSREISAAASALR